MKKHWLLVAGLSLWPAALAAQDKPVIVVQPFTTAEGVMPGERHENGLVTREDKVLYEVMKPDFTVECGKVQRGA